VVERLNSLDLLMTRVLRQLEEGLRMWAGQGEELTIESAPVRVLSVASQELHQWPFSPVWTRENDGLRVVFGLEVEADDQTFSALNVLMEESVLAERLLEQALAQWPIELQGQVCITTSDQRVLGGFCGSKGTAAEVERAGQKFSQLVSSRVVPGWFLGYHAGADELPQADLFPIILGTASGSLLVPALAWILFRENRSQMKAAQQRVSFANQISHELRTPLTNIRLYAEMLEAQAEKRGDVLAIKHLAVVTAESHRLTRLIDNVLNFSMRQRDRLQVSLKPLNLVELLIGIEEQWAPVLGRKGMILVVESLPECEIMADRDALEQIFYNLLSNSEKYAGDGKVVKISANQAGNCLQLLVEDEGPGIPEGRHQFIFEPFERLRSDLREGVSGTGIGLTISRELARLHGGDLVADPLKKGGARFVLTLPLQKSAAGTAEWVTPESPASTETLLSLSRPVLFNSTPRKST
jgi:signal transduction histidine kinase